MQVKNIYKAIFLSKKSIKTPNKKVGIRITAKININKLYRFIFNFDSI